MLGPVSDPRLKLYVQPGSHPWAAVEAALALKGINYDRVDLLPLSQMLIGPLRYGGITVPGVRLGGERVLGSRAIMRRLDLMAPEPALLPPPGTAAREEVLEAERWGDEVFQAMPRRIINVAFRRRPGAMESYADDAHLPLPTGLMRPTLPLMSRLLVLRNRASDEGARADLLALPGQLERIDGWIAGGVLGGEQPNAADLQIGGTIRLLLSVRDLAPLIESRPSGALVRYFPPMSGRVEAGVLPAAWITAASG
jgi:glutathione S-transferase